MSQTFNNSQKVDVPSRVVLHSGDMVVLDGHEYQVVDQLGAGGFGSVYHLKSQENLHYALKILDQWRRKPSEWEGMATRFNQSVEIANYRSPYLLRTFTHGVIEGNPYHIIEYCSNGALSDHLDDFRQAKDFHDLGVKILRGLQVLHNNGIVHRDIKPENILFNQQKQPKITDFDISFKVSQRRTERNWLGLAKEVWGTLLYSPPEQLSHRKSFSAGGPTMDIYAFGVMMYEVATGGRFPFFTMDEYEKDPVATIKKLKPGMEPRPIQQFNSLIPEEWIKAINGCLKIDHKKRFQDVQSVLSAVGDYLHEDVFHSSIRKEQGSILSLSLNSHKIDTYYLDNLSDSFEKSVLHLGFQEDGDIQNDIPIFEEATCYVSHRHSTLEKVGEQWFIRDGQWDEYRKEWIPSKNGTFVNGRPIESGEVILLSQGDRIRLGGYQFNYEVT